MPHICTECCPALTASKPATCPLKLFEELGYGYSPARALLKQNTLLYVVASHPAVLWWRPPWGPWTPHLPGGLGHAGQKAIFLTCSYTLFPVPPNSFTWSSSCFAPGPHKIPHPNAPLHFCLSSLSVKSHVLFCLPVRRCLWIIALSPLEALHYTHNKERHKLLNPLF